MPISSNDKAKDTSEPAEFDETSSEKSDRVINSQAKDITVKVEGSINGSTNKIIVSPVTQLRPMLKYTVRGTQTPLILVKTMRIQSFIEKKEEVEKELSTNVVTSEVNDVEKAEILSDGLPETVQEQDFTQDKENPESSTSVRSFFPELRTEKVSTKCSQEAATQATPPYPSLTSAESSPPSAGILQIVSSECSNGSLIKSEVLTVTTDYGTRTPDAGSVLVENVNQDRPKPYGNIQSHKYRHDPRSSIQQGPSGILQYSLSSEEEAETSDSHVRRSSRLSRWKCGICIRRNVSAGEEADTQPYGQGPPPTYSSIFTEPRSIFNTSRPPPLLLSNDRSSFIAPIPPPSYTQAQGICMATYSMDQLISVSPSGGGPWLPRPTPAICPRCAALVVTVVDVRRSVVTHVAALVLFLFGCWPCCLIPYCVDSCKSTHHYCPVCRTYLGTYSPW